MRAARAHLNSTLVQGASSHEPVRSQPDIAATKADFACDWSKCV